MRTVFYLKTLQFYQQEGSITVMCWYCDTIILDDPTIIQLDDDALLFEGIIDFSSQLT